MSEPPYTWWPYVRNMIRRYEMRKKCAKLERVPQLEQNAVAAAIEKTRGLDCGSERLALIERVHMKRSRVSLYRAAIELYISYTTAKRWNREFFLDVAEARGLYDPPETEGSHINNRECEHTNEYIGSLRGKSGSNDRNEETGTQCFFL